MEETSWGWRRTEMPFEGGGMDGWMNLKKKQMI
jgi:hypothetical protein